MAFLPTLYCSWCCEGGITLKTHYHHLSLLPQSSIILEHSGNENPWTIDSHMFYDDDTKRLWMTWGGHETFISELDPKTGMLCCTPNCKDGAGVCASPKFTTHAAGVHTKILSWSRDTNQTPKLAMDSAPFQGDGCGQEYMEGPALWKHEGKFFALASWGSMGTDYTIRVCRSDTPRGPFLDKGGVDCAKYVNTNSEEGTFGSSMLFGAEDEQSVPGHPHIWKETDSPGLPGVRWYMGYDYRRGAATKSSGEEGRDYMAVRRLHWILDAPGANGKNSMWGASYSHG